MKKKKNNIEDIDDIFIDTSRTLNNKNYKDDNQLNLESELNKNNDDNNDLDLEEEIDHYEIKKKRLNSLNFKNSENSPKIIKDIIIEREDILNKDNNVEYKNDSNTNNDAELLKNKMLMHGLKKQVNDNKIDIKIIDKETVIKKEHNLKNEEIDRDKDRNVDSKMKTSFNKNEIKISKENKNEIPTYQKRETLVDKEIANINKMIEEKKRYEEEQKKNKILKEKNPEELIKNMATKILPSDEEYENMKKNIVLEQNKTKKHKELKNSNKEIQNKKQHKTPKILETHLDNTQNEFNDIDDDIDINIDNIETDNIKENKPEIDRIKYKPIKNNTVLKRNTKHSTIIPETKKPKNILDKNETFSHEINNGMKKFDEEDELKPLTIYEKNNDDEFDSLYENKEEKEISKIFVIGMTLFAFLLVVFIGGMIVLM